MPWTHGSLHYEAVIEVEVLYDLWLGCSYPQIQTSSTTSRIIHGSHVNQTCEASVSSLPLPWTRRIGGVIFIAGLTFLAYAPSLSGGFIMDDDLYLTRNSLISSPSGLHGFWFTTLAVNYHPVSNSSLWLEWRLWGLNSTGYHVTNVLLHIGASLLIWAIFQQLSIPAPSLPPCCLPFIRVNMEVVASIAQRKDSLAVFFSYCLYSVT